MNPLSILDAVRTALGVLGYPVHLVDAGAAQPQYLVLGGKAWDIPAEPGLSPTRSLETEMRVTAAAGTPEGVIIMLGSVRQLLSPDLQPLHVSMDDWSLHLLYARSEFVGIDTSTTITATNRSPAYGVDSYQLAADPA